MRNMKKWLAFMLCALMLVNTLGITAMATENESPIALSVSPAAVSGAPVEVRISATEAFVVADGKLIVTYDPAVLTFVDAAHGNAWSDPELVTLSVNPTEGKVILAFASADPSNTGVLFCLNFTAKKVADTTIALDGSSYISDVTADLAQEVFTCASIQFNDLDSLFPEAHAAVDYMVASGYMNGMSQTAFGPHVELNRAMMVTILYRVDNCPGRESDIHFTDVPEGQFYTDAVAWAITTGITNGVSEHLFAPGKSLTRQELVTFLYRYAEVRSQDMTPAEDLTDYTDSSEIQPYAVAPFQWAVAKGIIKGTTETTLDPEATTTRAQVALMVYRMLSSWE